MGPPTPGLRVSGADARKQGRSDVQAEGHRSRGKRGRQSALAKSGEGCCEVISRIIVRFRFSIPNSWDRGCGMLVNLQCREQTGAGLSASSPRGSRRGARYTRTCGICTGVEAPVMYHCVIASHTLHLPSNISRKYHRTSIHCIAKDPGSRQNSSMRTNTEPPTRAASESHVELSEIIRIQHVRTGVKPGSVPASEQPCPFTPATIVERGVFCPHPSPPGRRCRLQHAHLLRISACGPGWLACQKVPSA